LLNEEMVEEMGHTGKKRWLACVGDGRLLEYIGGVIGVAASW
jgi:hypothetical protein